MITNSSQLHSEKILIVTHSLDEAITQCIHNNKDKLEARVIIVTLKELMDDYEIFDELDDDGSTVRWYKSNGLCISSADHLLLNRVQYLPSALFKDFIENDKEYAEREFEAYLGFAFNSFRGVGNKSAKANLAELLSLPQQWRRIKDEFNLNTPKYYWGPLENNNLNKSAELVYSSIFNFLNWSVAKARPEEDHVFCFEKPAGTPIFILSIGNEQLITADCSISASLGAELKEIARKINAALNYFISEVLIFVDGKHLNFGCINHELIRSNKNVSFDSFVCDKIISEFYQCLN